MVPIQLELAVKHAVQNTVIKYLNLVTVIRICSQSKLSEHIRHRAPKAYAECSHRPSLTQQRGSFQPPSFLLLWPMADIVRGIFWGILPMDTPNEM